MKLIKTPVELLRKLTLTQQILLVFALSFLVFLFVQLFFSVLFFENYYEQEQRDIVTETISEFHYKIDKVENKNYFLEILDFNSSLQSYSVVLDYAYNLKDSDYFNYIIEVREENTDQIFKVLLFDPAYDATIGDEIFITITPYNEEYYTAKRLKFHDTFLYNNYCSSDCLIFNGVVTDMKKPDNLNYLYINNPYVISEIANIENINFTETEYEEGSIFYISNTGTESYMVFIHDLGDFEYLMTIIPIEDSNIIVNIMNKYQAFLYLFGLIFFIMAAYYSSKSLTTPIKNIEKTANEIANLNFNIEVYEYTNQETKSLSKSINLIANNLQKTITTLNDNADEIQHLYDEKVKQEKIKKDLVSSISHELKTPLMVMQVTIQGILDNLFSEDELEDELNNVIYEINKSSTMIQDMLQVYRLDDINSKLVFETVSINKIVESILHQFNQWIVNKQFNVIKNISHEYTIQAENKLIARVISNFITNALKYTPDNETIQFDLYDDDHHVYFSIINYGTSLTDNEMQNIWNPFFSSEKSQSNTKLKGSGIGLYLVKQILEAYNFEYGIVNVKNGVKAYFIAKK